MPWPVIAYATKEIATSVRLIPRPQSRGIAAITARKGMATKLNRAICSPRCFAAEVGGTTAGRGPRRSGSGGAPSLGRAARWAGAKGLGREGVIRVPPDPAATYASVTYARVAGAVADTFSRQTLRQTVRLFSVVAGL